MDIPSEERSPSYNGTLEKVPVEIRIKILSYITDLRTLSNLIHATPVYHQAYSSVRNKVLTNVTIHDLAARSIDILHPAPVCELALKFSTGHGPSSGRQLALRGRFINIEDTTFREQILKDIAEAMHRIYIHELAASANTTTSIPRELVLAIKHSLALRKIMSVEPWQLTYEAALSIARKPGTGLINGHERYCFHWACSHLVRISMDREHAITKIKSDWIWPERSPFAVENGCLVHCSQPRRVIEL
ncbi:hypothetical protein G7Y79_00024g055000 [Physcia stellaris]|nr:hypothetical protein G7Y79_00024g055000 [Physcia stellaris]